ncbi:MAG: UrcA family protein [Rhodospirillales bacterium]
MQWTAMKTAWLAAGLGVALAAPPASAAEVETRSVTVSLKGLDLAAPEGQAIATQRIAQAAKEACGTVDVRDLNALADYETCHSAALSTASVQMHSMVAAAEARTRLAAK